MIPTLSATGDVLLVERLSTQFRKIRSGDVVMALSPENPRILVCKRVLGLEGDRVSYLSTDGRGRSQHAIVGATV
jgi:inner membrane protease subunit 1